MAIAARINEKSGLGDGSLLAEVFHDEAKMKERRETLPFLSFLPDRERLLLAGNVDGNFVWDLLAFETESRRGERIG